MSTEEVKAVIFDIDGTAISNHRRAVPSDAVVRAVNNAQNRGLILSFATGRNYAIAKRIIDALSLNEPGIVSAGTQIVEASTGDKIWSEPMSETSSAFALSILAPHKFKVLVDGDSYDTAQTADLIEPKSYELLDVQDVPKDELQAILDKLAEDTSIKSIPVHSNDPNYYFLHITSKLATKEHAVKELLKILGVDKQATAGVGDGLNDLELFKSVGTKVAMGNAVEELKQAADEVVATVEEDGLAQYLEGLAQ